MAVPESIGMRFMRSNSCTLDQNSGLIFKCNVIFSITDKSYLGSRVASNSFKLETPFPSKPGLKLSSNCSVPGVELAWGADRQVGTVDYSTKHHFFFFFEVFLFQTCFHCHFHSFSSDLQYFNKLVDESFRLQGFSVTSLNTINKPPKLSIKMYK